MNRTSGKILALEDLVDRVRQLRQSGKVIVQSHGVYDLIHPGVIQHLASARARGDILVVTVIRDADVRRGPGRPIFPDHMRAENVAALTDVDLVAVVEDGIPFESARRINPDYFAKGVAYKDQDRHLHDRIFQEEREFHFGKIKLLETDGFSFSSTEIINRFLDIYPPDTRAFLDRFRKKFSLEQIAAFFDRMRSFKVLLIGDAIIDEYHYCRDMSKSAKAQLVVNRYLGHEVFAGGVFAIANHLAGMGVKVSLGTVLGSEDSWEDFARAALHPMVEPHFFFRQDGPTVRKKRYINQYLNQKLFEINYLSDTHIDPHLENRILDHLRAFAPNFDLILLSDFGHGLVTKRIIDASREAAPFLAVNTQTNGANAGYNLITRYRRPDFVCLDEMEVRLAAQDKAGDIESVIQRVAEQIQAGCLITTLGKKGSIGVRGAGEMCRTPIFSTKVVDTVGAGDAFFSYAALCHFAGMPLELVSFIGNAVGALAVQIVGNKDSVKRAELLQFVSALLK